VVWWGRMAAGDVVDVVAAYRPRQVAYRSPQGLSVEVPQEAISDMIVRLPAGVFVATCFSDRVGEAINGYSIGYLGPGVLRVSGQERIARRLP
jgi:hypothetical protein